MGRQTSLNLNVIQFLAYLILCITVCIAVALTENYQPNLSMSYLLLLIGLALAITPSQVKSLKQELAGPPAKIRPALQQKFSQSQRFVRGEVLEAGVQKGLDQLLELSLTEARKRAAAQDFDGLKKEIHPWVLFAADIAYEEGSIEAMRYCHQIRVKIISTMLELSKKYPQLGPWKSWLVQWPLPWPVDRMVVAKARQLLPTSLEPQLQTLTADLRKNPYQSLQTCTVKLFGAKGSQNFQQLFNVWTDPDIGLMKSEIESFRALLSSVGSN